MTSLQEIEYVGGTRPREDRMHGALLVMAELLRCANADWERINRELEELIPITSSVAAGRNISFTSMGVENSTESQTSSGVMNILSSDKHHGMASLKGAMRRYYQSGISRHTPSATGSTQIPFNWFGSVPLGREQIVESAIVSLIFLSQLVARFSGLHWNQEIRKSRLVTYGLVQ